MDPAALDGLAEDVVTVFEREVFEDVVAGDAARRVERRLVARDAQQREEPAESGLSAVGLLPLRCGIAWSASYAVQANTILCQTVPDPA